MSPIISQDLINAARGLEGPARTGEGPAASTYRGVSGDDYDFSSNNGTDSSSDDELNTAMILIIIVVALVVLFALICAYCSSKPKPKASSSDQDTNNDVDLKISEPCENKTVVSDDGLMDIEAPSAGGPIVPKSGYLPEGK